MTSASDSKSTRDQTQTILVTPLSRVGSGRVTTRVPSPMQLNVTPIQRSILLPIYSHNGMHSQTQFQCQTRTRSISVYMECCDGPSLRHTPCIPVERGQLGHFDSIGVWLAHPGEDAVLNTKDRYHHTRYPCPRSHKIRT